MNYWPLLILAAIALLGPALGMFARRNVFGQTIGAYARIWRHWSDR